MQSNASFRRAALRYANVNPVLISRHHSSSRGRQRHEQGAIYDISPEAAPLDSRTLIPSTRACRVLVAVGTCKTGSVALAA